MPSYYRRPLTLEEQKLIAQRRAEQDAIWEALRAKKHAAALGLHAKLATIDLATIRPFMDGVRHVGRKQAAVHARALFTMLGLRGISVTTPNYSMASTVHIGIPKRRDLGESEICPHSGQSIGHRNDPAHQANNAADQKIRDILQKAFPGTEDRSDTQSDHFDYLWSLS